MEKKNQVKKADLLPFYIIKAASDGDVEAINTVVDHYEGYIIRLSIRKMYDEYGQIHFCIDEILRRHLETKLITKVLDFKIA
ncbi:Helix-turn-helix, conjugative transposon-like [Anaerobutyricum hallii]|uniref:Helix-turn-helix, conjugative transposon-like n=1 Tax=Anaerobutyricum hallii TaxID=39488 RepID=A0A285PY14_9FIRM|nr:helix-turn-helix domain-containing protein [Anaerobutyricum hallii]SOB72640.1 Helix-turn-helix, conjugative transposon-like [Anaerobutyricum hallii]